MRASAPLLSVRDLSLTHAGAAQPSPRDVSFDARPGEVVLVLGPSGSGKSTLTLALNGLIPQSVPADVAGAVEVNGRDTVETPVAQLSSDVAMVFQDPDAQLVTGTVLDEVAFALENLLLPVTEVLSRTEQALRRVGLWERRSWNPDRLSGGGRQRLAIACAIAMGSPLIVLDEPTANLDPQGIDDVYDALTDLVASGDRAVILVEHNLDAAMRFATRAIVLDQQGRLVFDGPAAEVLRGHTDELISMGVWLPTATLAGRMLRERGILPEDAPLPLTPEELAAALPEERLRLASLAHPVSSPAAAPPSLNDPQQNHPGKPTSSIIRARNLTVKRGRTEVLHGIDLDIPAGSLTAIVGANGAGKTTLIQSLAGVVPPPKNRVTIDDLDPGRSSPRDLAARVGFVFQNPEHQFIAHTVFNELAHGLRLRGTPDAEIGERVGEMLARFGLEHKAEVHPFLLSGGEKRRLSVGTALITRPRVLALDEPTFGQDRARADELLRLLEGLRDEGTTIVIVTHDLQLVADHTTHTVILADGRVHASGETAELFATEGLFESAGLRLPALHRALNPELRGILTEAVR
ncbi:energy-coupling factor transporter ATPase [Microbacterium aerolatum]|uniref:ABC transporter ATP-binding protein n=1 Tax=Microbacterium aerolatum TaxID=153731 RepID=UPI0020009A19|nr:ABC transporter ATP-binding protein [Microbacterium aerolatum]MCK3768759.1 energy-coupling factor transporter ATPase [Microbacterium aerolatum]